MLARPARNASSANRTNTDLEHFSVIFPVSLRARRIVHTVFALAPWANRLKNALRKDEEQYDPVYFDAARCATRPFDQFFWSLFQRLALCRSSASIHSVKRPLPHSLC